MCCGSRKNIVVDHIYPISKYPSLSLEFDNLQVLCNDCNQGKSNDDFTDFRPDAPKEEFKIPGISEEKLENLMQKIKH